MIVRITAVRKLRYPASGRGADGLFNRVNDVPQFLVGLLRVCIIRLQRKPGHDEDRFFKPVRIVLGFISSSPSDKGRRAHLASRVTLPGSESRVLPCVSVRSLIAYEAEPRSSRSGSYCSGSIKAHFGITEPWRKAALQQPLQFRDQIILRHAPRPVSAGIEEIP
jgi:hypothetical protein